MTKWEYMHLDHAFTASCNIGLFKTPKKKLTGCAAPVFDRILLAQEILVENIPLAKEDFLTISTFLPDFKEFQPKYSLFKRNFPKTDANLAPKWQFLRVFALIALMAPISPQTVNKNVFIGLIKPSICGWRMSVINTLRLKQNGRQFSDRIFKLIVFMKIIAYNQNLFPGIR